MRQEGENRAQENRMRSELSIMLGILVHEVTRSRYLLLVLKSLCRPRLSGSVDLPGYGTTALVMASPQ